MQKKRVSVRLAYKVNMGNYETLDIDYGAEGEQDGPHDTLDSMFEELYDWVNTKVGEEMKRARAASKVGSAGAVKKTR